MKARGEKEQACLDTVKPHLRQDIYFGMSHVDVDFIEQVIRTAQPNPSSSEFPDFVFEDGFIEHFQITSSAMAENGGSIQLQKTSEHRKSVDAEIKEIERQLNETPSFDKPITKEYRAPQAQHSYDFLVSSFRRNWESHIESMRKYNGSREHGIFLVEYNDHSLAMYEEVGGDLKSGLRYGDLAEARRSKNYRLTYDANMLNYIYNYKDDIEYVIYVYDGECEIIKTENIPELLKLLPWNFDIYELNLVNYEFFSAQSFRTGGDTE